ncbi:MAG: hypothetical protein GHCLOJNM_03075 [bacterium]|nr:hypothetical protein [bacterium]
MAIGKASDFVIYDEQFQSGQVEVLAQNLNLFNAASNGAIVLRSEKLPGNYSKSAFFPMTSGLVTRRDTTSVSGVTDIALTQAEIATVKLNRKMGPVAQTLDAWKKMGATPELMSFVFGKQVGVAKIQDHIDIVLAALVAALEGVSGSALVFDGTAATMKHSAIVSGMSKLGDAAQRVACLVMHSKPFFDLIQQAITDKVYGIANTVVYGGSPGTLGKPVVVIDSPSLVVAGSPTTYRTLGLTVGAAEVVESEAESVAAEVVTGLENLVGRVQAEYAINLGLKGFTWDVTNGGANPTAGAIGTGSNWDKKATSVKDLGGIVVQTQ